MHNTYFAEYRRRVPNTRPRTLLMLNTSYSLQTLQAGQNYSQIPACEESPTQASLETLSATNQYHIATVSTGTSGRTTKPRNLRKAITGARKNRCQPANDDTPNQVISSTSATKTRKQHMRRRNLASNGCEFCSCVANILGTCTFTQARKTTHHSSHTLQTQEMQL